MPKGKGGALVGAGIDEFNRGRYEEAIRDFSAALEESRRLLDRGQDARLLLFRSMAYQMAGDPRLALADMRLALRREPRSVAVRLGAAGLFGALGRGAQALAQCARALRLDSGSAEAWELRSRIEENRGRATSALESLRRALALKAPRARKAEWGLRAARLFLESGGGEAALEECRKAVALDRANAEGWELKGDLEARLGSREEAVRSLARSLALEAPKARKAKRRLKAARLLSELGRGPEARRECLRALEGDPRSVEAWQTRAELEWRAGLRKEAVSSLRRAMALTPGGSEWSLKAARLLSDLGRHGEAIQKCARVLGADPKNAEAWELRADLEWKAGRRRQALGSLRRALALEPGRIPWQLKAARRLFEGGRFLEALRRCRAALARDPESAEGWELTADIEWRRGRPESALRLLRRGLSLEPAGESGSRRHLKEARLLVDLGRSGEALEPCRRAVEADARNAEAGELKAQLESRLGVSAGVFESLRKLRLMVREGSG